MTAADPLVLIVFGGGLVSFLGLFLFLFSLKQGTVKRRLTRRLGQIHSRGGHGQPAQTETNVRRSTRNSSIPGLDRLIGKWLPHPDLLRRRLERTGRNITAGEYVLVSLLLAATAFGCGNEIFALPLPMSFILAVIIGGGLPHVAVGVLTKRRMKKFVRLFPEAIDLIVRGLKSGLPVTEGITVVAEEIIDPVGTEFNRISDAMKLGRTMEEALWEAAERIAVPEFKFFVISLSVQRETGGNLTETLENLSDILRRRQQMQLKIKALSSEAKASALIIGSLPFVIGAILMVINPEYVLTLGDDPRGRFMVGVGLFWLMLGGLVMGKMVRFEV